MTVWVLRDGKLVEKWTKNGSDFLSDFPSPRVSRMESYASPVDDRSISSWRQRDWDMKRVDAVDRRDLPDGPFIERRERNAAARLADAQRDSPTEWVDRS
jgi:hypothetical protein